MPKLIITKINSILYNFLWDGKREKIKRVTLIGNKLQGGLDMIDLETYINTMKLKWVKSLLSQDDANWKVIPKYHFQKFGSNFLIFYYNIDNINGLNAKHLPEFYSNLLNTWIKSSYKHGKQMLTFNDIRKQIIWGNQFIKLNKKCLVFPSWINSNLIFINDIINEQGEIKENFILTKLDDKRNWISELAKIIKALPNDWKRLLKTKSSYKTKVKTTLSLSIGNLDFMECNNKAIYQQLLSTKFQTPIAHRFWNDKFSETLPWSEIYNFINRIQDNRYKQYKYRVINNIFPTRAIRYKWKMVNSPNCLQCHELEDYEHVFTTCSSVQLFWEKVISVFKKCGIESNIKTLKAIVVGYKVSHTDYMYVNIILTIVGFCIYKSYFLSENWTMYYDIYNTFTREIQILLHLLKYKGLKNSFISRVEKAIFH